MQPSAFDALTVSTMETLIEIIGFVASSISTKSFLSATSAFHGGVVLGVTGATTHTDPTDILSIRIRPSTPATDMTMVTMAMVTGHPAMVTDMTTHWGVTTAVITAARTTKMTMKVLCATFSPNTQLLGPAMTWPHSVVSSPKTVTT